MSEPIYLSPTELDWLVNHGKIQAIKMLRERTGLDLRDSKLIVDSYEAILPQRTAMSEWNDLQTRILNTASKLGTYISGHGVENLLDACIKQVESELELREVRRKVRYARGVVNRSLKVGH